MYFYIDYREKWFTDTMLEKNINYDEPIKFNTNQNTENHIIKSASLPIGDFIISNDENMNDIVLIIERKTYKDLSSSITDGRFRQQKDRIEDSIDDVSKILYILEGSSKALKNGVSKTIIQGSILNLLYKHNFKILQTENQNDSFENLMLIFKKHALNDFIKKNSTTPVKLLSKKDKINENIVATQLSIIPGVSYNTAKIISEKYNNIKTLIDEYNKQETDKSKENMLCNIQITNTRKLGIALSKKIYKSLCQN